MLLIATMLSRMVNSNIGGHGHFCHCVSREARFEIRWQVEGRLFCGTWNSSLMSAQYVDSTTRIQLLRTVLQVSKSQQASTKQWMLHTTEEVMVRLQLNGLQIESPKRTFILF